MVRDSDRVRDGVGVRVRLWIGWYMSEQTEEPLCTQPLLKLNDIVLHDKSSQSYEASLAVSDHTVLPAT